MKFEKMYVNTLSDKTFFQVVLEKGETAQVGRETLYGPCWAVVTSSNDPTKDGKKGLIWWHGKVRYSAQNPVRRLGIINPAWKRHYHPQSKLQNQKGNNPFWSLPQYDGTKNPTERAYRINASGGYTPEVPAGYVLIDICRMASTSWVMLREDDTRILEVKKF